MFKFFDGHCDTITTAMEKNERLLKNNLHIDIHRLFKFAYPAQIFSVWCKEEYLNRAFLYTDSALDFFEKEVLENDDFIDYAFNAHDIDRNRKNKKISAFLGIEGGEALEGKIENLEHFYERGVRVLTLCWNRENELGFGAATGINKGLKEFGKNCVKKMNELGIIIDVSHLNEEGFWDVSSLSSKPFIASHSNAFNVCGHKRNLKDNQILAIAEKKGIIGLNLYPHFLCKSSIAGIEEIMMHLKYFINLIGDENLGLGCDFDGIDITPKGIKDVSFLNLIYDETSRVFGSNCADRIFFENYYEFWKGF